MNALERTGQSENRRTRFAHCGCKAWVIQHATKGYKVSAAFCRDRFCPRCGAARSRVASAIIANLCRGKIVRFVTLTLRHQPISLTQQLDRIYECFRRLKQRKWWQANVVGGVATIEVKRSAAGAWHVHLHALIEGAYMPQRELSAEWLAVTGDSPIVDVRAVKDQGNAVGYIAKYVGKPLDMSTAASEEATDELIRALKGRRAMMTFGTWFNQGDEDEPEDKGEWKAVGPLDEIYEGARRGYAPHRQIIDALKPGLCLRQMFDYDHRPRRDKPPPD